MRIYVGNIPNQATEDDLQTAFSAFGQVASAQIIVDRFSGQPRGFGFVEMPNSAEGQAAIAGLNGKDLKGRALAVNEARPRQDRGDAGRGGAGGDRRGSGGGGGFGGWRWRWGYRALPPVRAARVVTDRSNPVVGVRSV